MRFDGAVERMVSVNISAYTLGGTIIVQPRSNAQDCIAGTCWAKDARHAIKIFNEKRVQLIASGEFKDPKLKETR